MNIIQLVNRDEENLGLILIKSGPPNRPKEQHQAIIADTCEQAWKADEDVEHVVEMLQNEGFDCERVFVTDILV